MPSVDVILPNYLYRHYRASCVESVLSQASQNTRVVITDNASIANSLEVAGSLAATASRGTARCRNDRGVGSRTMTITIPLIGCGIAAIIALTVLHVLVAILRRLH